jgi:tRNA nucleotidyltransferase (CCA-adding enzyme)
VRPQREIDSNGLEARLGAIAGLADVRAAARDAGVDAYVVGGAVRDALLEREPGHLDVVVDGDHRALIEALEGEVRAHDRFETATVETAAGPVDVARARTETYAHPGALPEVRPATIAEDLGRRDFTINAIAVPLERLGEPLDPHGGIADLGAGLLRSLHQGSFGDDPTRALRAARYAARLGFEVEEQTLAELRDADLATVSVDRAEADLRRLAAEPQARRGFELLEHWGLIALPEGAGESIAALGELLDSDPWAATAERPEAVLAAARGQTEAARALVAAEPNSPSAAVAAARGHHGVDLALARALGAGWLDDYVSRWREVRASISGEDLLAAGVPEGPAVGRGLEAALRAKLDGEAEGRERELEIALEAARS